MKWRSSQSCSFVVVVGLALAAAADGWLVAVARIEHLRQKRKKIQRIPVAPFPLPTSFRKSKYDMYEEKSHHAPPPSTPASFRHPAASMLQNWG